MMTRAISAFSVLLLLTAASDGKKNKTEGTFPDEILRSRNVAVVVDPLSGTPITGEDQDRIAQSDIEAALRTWGRFKLTAEPTSAGLLIVVHKGRGLVNPTIGGGSPNDRPVIVNHGDINVGIRTGTPPRSSPGDTRNGGPPTPRTDRNVSQGY
jgi:hypothetical protein